MSIKKNDSGKILSDPVPLLKDEAYGTGKHLPNGWPEIKWPPADENIDAQGFDKRVRYGVNALPGKPYQREVTLDIDTVLVRYGLPSGRFTAPLGTDYELLALPYLRETIEFHKYKVANPINATIIEGIVAPAFGSPGGAVQYVVFGTTIQALLEDGFLEEIDI